MGINFWRFWYLRHFDSKKLYAELAKPVEGEYVVVRDSATMSTRVRRDQLEEYIRCMGERR